MTIYYVDIDGTILTTPVKGDYTKSMPYPDRIEIVNALFDAGHTVVYWTARGTQSGIDWHDFTVKQLAEFGCKYTQLRTDKPHYDAWIDDKAINANEFFNL